MPIGTITPGEYVTVTPDASPAAFSSLQTPTTTITIQAAHIQSLTLSLLNAQKRLADIISANVSPVKVYYLEVVGSPDVSNAFPTVWVPVSEICSLTVDNGHRIVANAMYWASLTNNGAGGGNVAIVSRVNGGPWLRMGGVEDIFDFNDEYSLTRPNHPRFLVESIGEGGIVTTNPFTYDIALGVLPTGAMQGLTVFSPSRVTVQHFGVISA